MVIHRILYCCTLAVTLFFASPATADNQPLTDTELAEPGLLADLQPLARMLDANRPREALEMARFLADTWAGDPDFQYLYGLAALYSDELAEAILALEASLIVRPEDHRARLELARAHYRNSNWTSARRHFEQVLAMNPPQQVRHNIRRFLDRIDVEERRSAPTFSLTGRYLLGHDSNVNSATDAEFVELGIFRLPLSDEARETSDTYQVLGLEAFYHRPLSQRRGLDLQAGVERKDNFSEDAFDLDSFRLSAGYRLNVGQRSQLRLATRARQVNLDNDRLHWLGGVSAEWRHRYSDFGVISASTSLSTLRYPDSHERDANQLLFSVGSVHQSGALRHQLTLITALEPTRDNEAEHLGRNFAGLSGGTHWAITPRHGLTASALFMAARFDEVHPVFAKRRHDRQLALTTGWQWTLTDNLTLQTEVLYNRTDSNIDFYDYDRIRAQAGVRYRFF